MVLLIFVLCLFLPAGTWMWTKGWLFILVIVVDSILGTLYLSRVNPDVIAARVNRHEGTKRWDRLLRATLPLSILAILILAAFDDARFHWFPVSWWVCVLGFVFLITGMAGSIWAQSVNKFFEPTVRIQTDRGHRSLTPVPMPSFGIRDTSPPSLSSLGCPWPGFLVGIDPRYPVVPGLGRANGLGGPNPSRRVAWL